MSSEIGNVNYYKTGDKHLSMGNLCSIATDSRHNYRSLVWFQQRVYCCRWTGVTIMYGVHIGQGCIVVAGLLVTKTPHTYSIVGGVPANVIEMLFSERFVEKLQTINLKKI